MKTGRKKGRKLFLAPNVENPVRALQGPRLAFPDLRPESVPCGNSLLTLLFFLLFFLSKLYLPKPGFPEVCLADMLNSTPQPV